MLQEAGGIQSNEFISMHMQDTIALATNYSRIVYTGL